LAKDLKDLVADILLDSKSIARGYFRRAAVEELINRNSQSVRYTPEVFSLVVLELWHRTFADSHSTFSHAVSHGMQALATRPIALTSRPDIRRAEELAR
jgi:hypothetical protein